MNKQLPNVHSLNNFIKIELKSVFTRNYTSIIRVFSTQRLKDVILQSTEVLNQSRGREKVRRKENYRRIKIPNLLKIQ